MPFVPTLSIVFNIALMTNLQALTWARLVVWMAVGFGIYFLYGINASRLNPESSRVNKSIVRSWGAIDDQARLTQSDTLSVGSQY